MTSFPPGGIPPWGSPALGPVGRITVRYSSPVTVSHRYILLCIAITVEGSSWRGALKPLGLRVPQRVSVAILRESCHRWRALLLFFFYGGEASGDVFEGAGEFADDFDE